MNIEWRTVHCPIHPDDPLPPERKVVLVWLGDASDRNALPFCGYIRYAAGDVNCPYFVVYHGNSQIGSDVVAWCDCLPNSGPDLPQARMFSDKQQAGRGFPAREQRNKL